MAKKKQKQNAAVKSSMVARTTQKAAPASTSTSVKRPLVPAMVQKQNSVFITHSEYAVDVYQQSIGLGTSSWNINPQKSDIFPWLSAIATRFEMYRFKKLRFRYAPSCSTTTGGYTCLGFDFDATDYAPTDAPSKGTMLTWKYSVKCSPWEGIILDLSPDTSKTPFKYCDTSRSEAITTFDPRFDALGTLFVIAEAPGASSSFIGEIFVDYEIELIQPAYKIPTALYYTARSVNNLPGADQPFKQPITTSGNMNVIFNPATPGSFTIADAGSFLVQLIETGTSITSALNALSMTTFPGSNATVSEVIRKYSSDGTKSWLEALLNVKTPPVQLTYSGGNGLNLSSDLRVSTYKA